ncbi:MAG TPA: bifunctional diguanylate cyclase/phosphodiesterase [Gemmatimonadaceae bacterium]|nr:bifunctional diguanylate cyclase/phosphodiesterase [Gemmatimonadaceae bacterium]
MRPASAARPVVPSHLLPTPGGSQAGGATSSEPVRPEGPVPVTPHQTPPGPQPVPGSRIDAAAPAAPLHGPLAASMERLTALAATALRAPLAFIALVGDDRRCFAVGVKVPAWVADDPGLLTRAGLLDRIAASDTPIVIEDVVSEAAAHQVHAARALEIAGLLGASLRLTTGECVGVLCAADSVPTTWTSEDVEMIAGLAATAAADLELRRELAEHEAQERRLRHDARHDALTGLANRTVFLERLRASLERERSPMPHAAEDVSLGAAETLVAVLFFDLDGFRHINERLGHRVGDQLLAALARRLEADAGAHACVARLGGDEFAVLLEQVDDPETAEQAAERLRTALTAPVLLAGQEVRVTVSAGISLSATLADLPEHLLRSADVALARAKRAARTSGVVAPVLFDWRISAEARARRRLEEELRHAVVHNEFALHYLPIVSLGSGRLDGAEALLRWQHPTRGLLAPSDFLGVAEELDLISEIGRWVLREACRQVQEWNRERVGAVPLMMAVNLSARQFASVAFLEEVARTVWETGLDPSNLALEVTERVVTQDVTRSAGTLVALRTLGVKIHLDDFGTGPSSLSTLQRLPLDAVKIDHTFVSRMERDEQAQRVVRTVVGLARELGLQSIAEGVSAAEHLGSLKALGCTHGQGPFFSPAVDASGIGRLLRSGREW